MTVPVKLNLKVYQGSTFKEVIRWESSTKVYAGITAITKSAPILITAIAHGIPVGWRTKITNVLGMKEVNSTEVYHTVTSTTTDTVTINAINALGHTDYISGGVFEYNQPVDLTGITARMQVRDKLTSDTVLLELTTENGGIIVDNSLKTITLVITATVTAAFTFTQGVYSLELQNVAGEVFPFTTGNVSVVKEVTR
jgi:hypothetical protein